MNGIPIAIVRHMIIPFIRADFVFALYRLFRDHPDLGRETTTLICVKNVNYKEVVRHIAIHLQRIFPIFVDPAPSHLRGVTPHLIIMIDPTTNQLAFIVPLLAIKDLIQIDLQRNGKRVETVYDEKSAPDSRTRHRLLCIKRKKNVIPPSMLSSLDANTTVDTTQMS